MFFAGAHFENWYTNGDTNEEGLNIDDLTSSLDLIQLISKPTNFEENRSPNFIDLIFTNQSNIVMESGTRPSLDNYCRHQIIFFRLNLRVPPDRDDTVLIQRAINRFPWSYHLANTELASEVLQQNDPKYYFRLHSTGKN